MPLINGEETQSRRNLGTAGVSVTSGLKAHLGLNSNAKDEISGNSGSLLNGATGATDRFNRSN
jgi:hypothetical protein